MSSPIGLNGWVSTLKQLHFALLT
eukprot:COSAG03_NODE_12781_length_531_cov_0.939815_2_plen_23_part_01